MLYVLVGLPGSGKSHWAKRKAEEKGCVIVSREFIRSGIKGGRYVFDSLYENAIRPIALDMISSFLKCGLDVIVDECHISEEIRTRLMNGLIGRGAAPEKVVCVYFTEQESCLENRMKSPRGYSSEKWAKIINGMRNCFEPPQKQEYKKIVCVNFWSTGVDSNDCSQQVS